MAGMIGATRTLTGTSAAAKAAIACKRAAADGTRGSMMRFNPEFNVGMLTATEQSRSRASAASSRISALSERF